MATETSELVSNAAGGDEAAWAALVDRFGGLVWSIARGSGLAETDAADVSQTTWLRFAEHLDRLRDPSAAAEWLATTARHEAIRVSRSAARVVLVDPWEVYDGAGPETEVDAAILATERARAVQEAMALLPVRCRSLLEALVADPPVSYAHISATLAMPVGSIGPTRARCLSHLRRLLAEVDARHSAASLTERATS